MSLYRKYRPQKFEDIIGQEHIVQTLQGALESGQIGHAYIFSGMRGTGKTSIARIFAKALNCLDLQKNEPCGKCQVCTEIVQGRFLDLIEIDAASNRGIDEIRDLKEKIRFAPNSGKYKVYIIDEVHMLTDQAFNALLKTLEEPPAHAMFILATTELHKVPATILSRCQRFDFHKIENEKMMNGVKAIIDKEKIKIDDKNLKKMISISEGSLRDALSYLDQVSAFSSGGEVSELLVSDVLGSSNEEKLYGALKIIKDKDISQLILFINEIVEDGGDIENFLKEFIRFVRNAMLLRISKQTTGELFENEEQRKTIESYSFGEMVALIEVLTEVLKSSKGAFISQLPLEIGLIKYIERSNGQPIGKGQAGNHIADKAEEKIVASNFTDVHEVRDDNVKNENSELTKTTGKKLFLEQIKQAKMMLYMALQNCDYKEDDGEIKIAIDNQFFFEKVNEKENKNILLEIIEKIFGKSKKLNISKKEQNLVQQKRDIVSDALGVFGGELIE
jgi:DNA polymerase-3 subunit gamma/tau